jgi:hypothetical protein
VAVLEITGGPITDSGAVRIRIKNLAGVERRATVDLLVPDGLEATRRAQEVTLGPWAELATSAPVVNRTALPGSRYPVFATVEYDEGGTHQAIVRHAIVEVVAPRPFFQAWRSPLWSAAGALVLLWLAFLARSLRARRGAARP